jgi:hypothetical protein
LSQEFREATSHVIYIVKWEGPSCKRLITWLVARVDVWFKLHWGEKKDTNEMRQI